MVILMFVKYGYYIILRIIIAVPLFINIVREMKFFPEKIIFYGALTFLAAIIDTLRVYKIKNSKIINFISMLFEIILIYYLTVNVSSDYLIYLMILLYDVIFFFEGKSTLFLIIYHFIFYITIWFRENNFDIYFNDKSFVDSIGFDFISNNLFYFSVIAVLYLLKRQNLERNEITFLNEKLKDTNNKLKMSLKKIKELVVEKERNRVAREIHDSLGHTLTALIMSLEYASKTLEINDTESAKKAIEKSQILARDSMQNVRKAIYTLKDTMNSENLKDSLNALITNLSLGNIKISMDIKGDIESYQPELKHVVYRSIQELITNSVKHGNADKIFIELHSGINFFYIEVSDNGKGCKKLSKGNGLNGIEMRVSEIGGQVEFCSEYGSGFITKINIPVKGESQ